jgi:hypothetical protein
MLLIRRIARHGRHSNHASAWARSLRLSPPRQARREFLATFAHTFVGTCVGVMFPQNRQPKISQFAFIDAIANGRLNRRPSEYRIDPLPFLRQVAHLAFLTSDYPSRTPADFAA